MSSRVRFLLRLLAGVRCPGFWGCWAGARLWLRVGGCWCGAWGCWGCQSFPVLRWGGRSSAFCRVDQALRQPGRYSENVDGVSEGLRVGGTGQAVGVGFA